MTANDGKSQRQHQGTLSAITICCHLNNRNKQISGLHVLLPTESAGFQRVPGNIVAVTRALWNSVWDNCFQWKIPLAVMVPGQGSPIYKHAEPEKWQPVGGAIMWLSCVEGSGIASSPMQRENQAVGQLCCGDRLDWVRQRWMRSVYCLTLCRSERVGNRALDGGRWKLHLEWPQAVLWCSKLSAICTTF